MWGIIKKAVNSDLSKPLNTQLDENFLDILNNLSEIDVRLLTQIAEIDAKLGTGNTNISTLLTRLGTSSDANNAATTFGQIRKVYEYLTAQLSSTRAARIDKIDTLETRIGTVNPTSAGTDTLFKYLKRVEDAINNNVPIEPYMAYTTTTRDTLIGETPFTMSITAAEGIVRKYGLLARIVMPYDGVLRVTCEYRLQSNSINSTPYAQALLYTPSNAGLGYVVDTNSAGVIRTSPPVGTLLATGAHRNVNTFAFFAANVYVPKGAPLTLWAHVYRLSTDSGSPTVGEFRRVRLAYTAQTTAANFAVSV